MREQDCGDVQPGLDLLIGPGELAELRVLHTNQATVSGYFDSTTKLAAQAKHWSGRAPGVYVTLNPVDPVLLSRAINRVQPYAKHTTSDVDILKRRWLPLDFDPPRPSGISSTDQEHEAALHRAAECRQWLRQHSWPEPLLADSGNGAHLLYRIDLPNDDDARRLVQTCLEALALRFDDDDVSIDLTTYNAARIWKVYGTWAAKGDSTQSRPHRFARLLDVPKELQSVPVELLNELAESMPQRSTPSTPASRDTFDLDEWLSEHGIGIARSGPWQGGRKYIFYECPWNSDHQDGAAYVVQFASGAIAAGCHHNSS